MTRLADAWRALEREQRTAALVSLGLFVSMLLPWYSKTDTVVIRNAAHATERSLSAFQAFSFVEAAVLLVSAGVLAMLFARAEGRDFQLPGGDGLIVMIAGGWAAVLIFYRLLDKPGLQGNQRITATVGVQWGIFIALLLALGLLYAGRRIRAGERGQPPLAGQRRRPREHERNVERERDGEHEREETIRRPPREEQHLAPHDPADGSEETTAISGAPARPARATPAPAASPAPGERRPRGRPRYPPAPSDQMSFEDAPPSGD
jgi:hypothetical protein